MDHHTAVHIVGGAARRILGPHIYQAGANKSTELARLDITHYRRLTRDDLDAIEILANEVLGQVSRTEKTILPRHEADKKHGFDLYQGGAPKGNEIRALRISDHDVQACGGTHHDEPGQIGSIRVVRSTAVQDGVERLHIVAGESALKFAREQDELLRATSQTFAVSSEDLPKTAERFFSEWKDQRKRIEQLEAEIVRLRTSGGGDDSTSVDGVRVVIMEVEGNLKQLTSMLQELTEMLRTQLWPFWDPKKVVEKSWSHAPRTPSLLSDTTPSRFSVPSSRTSRVAVVGDQQWRKVAVRMPLASMKH